jgi:heme oxygenase (biliverdin-IX-beta and delta-forming)
MPLTLNALPMATEVKNATQSLHAEVEELLLPRLAAIKTEGDYAVVLKMFYGFFQPLEKRLQQQVPPADLPDLHERRKAHSILRDLQMLGQNPANLSLCHLLPPVANTAQAFGVLYVLEGSTLGGRTIARVLSKNGAVPENALTFFSGYNEETGNKWKAFLAALNKQENTAAVTESAVDTFYYLKRWMQQAFNDEQHTES